MEWALEFCQKCWGENTVPDIWHEARVVMIFKKGDPACCDNYRPISLLQIGYKLFAIIILQSLRNAGAQQQIWPTQFGFKQKCGTNDALFVARRVIEEIWGMRDGKGVFLALDWAKAFDSISPEAMARALHRFGCPSKLVVIVMEIYKRRTFVVHDSGYCSKKRSPHYGICQGCPLFTIVMTVLLHDAREDFENMQGIVHETFVVQDLVYVEDTLLIGVDGDRVQGYMDSVVLMGEEYGLQLNWNKVEVLPCRMTVNFQSPNGENIHSN